MRLKLTYNRPGGLFDDVTIDADAQAHIGDVARSVADRDPRGRADLTEAGLTMRIDGPGASRVLRPGTALGDAGLRSGAAFSLLPATGLYSEANDDANGVVTISIQSGPDAGRVINLPSGSTQIGRERSNDIVLSDPMVSKRHARLNVGEDIEIVDLGSVNGLEVDGLLTSRTVLRPGDRVLLGDTELRVDYHRAPAAFESGALVEFNRSPYLNPIYEGREVEAPDVPEEPQPQVFPVLAMVAPLLFGVIMWVFTKELIAVIFMALSPFMMVGTWASTKLLQKRQLKKAIANFRMALDRLGSILDRDRYEEAAMRRREHVSVTEVVQGALGRANLLWAMRPDRHGFLEVRLGLATLPTRSTVKMPSTKKSIPQLIDELEAVVSSHAFVVDVPVVAPLSKIGALGIAGSRADALGSARAVIGQLAGLHSPSEVVLGVLAPSERAADWDWLKWLPHPTSAHSPVEADLLAAGAGSCNALVVALHDLIAKRSGGGDDAESSEPNSEVAVVVLVEDDAPVDRPRLVALAEHGREAGVYLIWVAPSTERLPAACEIFFTHDPATHAIATGFIEGGITVVPVSSEPLTADRTNELARDLSPVVDASAASDEASDVPQRVSFLAEMGLDLAQSSASVVDRWRQSDSLPLDPALAGHRRRNHTLQAYIGSSARGPFTLDLRSEGPHALVGGTTGAGKSEFLQSWIMGLATTHSPARITFLFVDYKGGAAFSECVKLPHSVGLVTDLTPHLVHRALRSLNAELRFREHILNVKKAKDVLTLEERGDPDCPPSLVIIVDEFAALVSEVPEFVDGVVNVAQRGRSLGLHLILATQRPAGVIRDNLRANTNLRVALRMADTDDSVDVIGTKESAMFDPGLPGRGVAKTGPGRLTLFQSAYVGGWTTDETPPPPMTIVPLVLGGATEWEAPEDPPDVVAARAAAEADPGPNDLHRLVTSVVGAADVAGISEPRKPWLPELAPVYDLARIPQSRTDAELVFAVADDPDSQRQVPISFYPDRDGNMSVIGTGGSGKSTFLRTLAVVAGLSTKGGPCHVYGLDFGSRGLHMLEGLPHVGSIISADDDERIARLIRTLRETIDERAERYAKARAGTITEYRTLADKPNEPRIVVLLDNISAFRQAYDTGAISSQFDRLVALAADGRQVGVHFVVAADRPNAIPTTLASVIQRHLVLRMPTEDDYSVMSVPRDVITGESPPGRGLIDEVELQVVVLGGSANTAHQARAMGRLSEELRDRGWPDAPEIDLLPEEIELSSLPASDGELLVVGIGDEHLEPFTIQLDSPLYITGPPASGKTAALLTIATAHAKAKSGSHPVLLSTASSRASQAPIWGEVIDLSDSFAGAEALEDLKGKIEGGQWSRGELGLFVDSVAQFAGSVSEEALRSVLAAAARSGHAVVAEADVDDAKGYSELLKFLRASRHGLALAPDQSDGEIIYRTAFPRLRTRVFPPGRGLYVRRGRTTLLQLALAADPVDAGEFSP